MGCLGESAVLFAFCLQKLMDRCSDADENTQRIPPQPHPTLYFIKGIHGLVDMVLGTSTSRLFRLKATRVFCNSARTLGTSDRFMIYTSAGCNL